MKKETILLTCSFLFYDDKKKLHLKFNSLTLIVESYKKIIEKKKLIGSNVQECPASFIEYDSNGR